MSNDGAGKASDAAEAVRRAADDLMGEGSDRARRDAAERLRRFADRVEAGEDGVRRGLDALERGVKAVEAGADRLAQKLSDPSGREDLRRHASERLSGLARKRPVATALSAAAAGVVLGAALLGRRSRD